jgi:hypothetical protein
VIDLDYPAIAGLFKKYADPKRSESASFLCWYLEHYYRLDDLEAVDTVCDQKGDRGVDGIFVNDSDQTITVFQARISQNVARTVGDASLREFAGTLTQFDDKASVQNILDTSPNTDLARLIKNLDILSKMETHDVLGEYITNIDIDANGLAFLSGYDGMTFVGKSELLSTHISDERDAPKHASVEFDVMGFQPTVYQADNLTSVVAPVRARELVGLEGIADQSLYAFNVRGPLGRTQVNKDIVKSIKDPGRHKLFPFFHNGITVIAQVVEVANEKIKTGEYFVVNGCQSLSSLYDNKSSLTDDLRVMVKFIKADPNSEVAEMITKYSNNQNGVRPRDFKSNHPIQIRLQHEFKKLYAGQYFYEIKRGEAAEQGIVISNEDAGLWLRAFDLKEPWTTHRRSEVFED